MPLDPGEILRLLQTIHGSVDTLRAHSSTHPKAAEAFEAAWRELRKLVLAADALAFEESEGALTAEGQALTGEPAADRLAVAMRDRRIRRIVLKRDTSSNDFRHLLELFVRSASDALIAGTLRPAIPQSMPSIELVAAERQEEPARQTGGYLRGSLLQRALGLRTLDELQSESGVVGVARLHILAQARPERFVTVVYRSDRVSVEIAHASRPFRDAMAGELTAERFSAEVSLTDPAGVDIIAWNDLRDRARRTGPYSAPETLKPEVRFRHQLGYVPGVVLDVLWEDPNPAASPEAWDIVDQYLQMIEALGLPLERPVAPSTPNAPAAPAPITDLASAAAACAGRWQGLDLGALIDHPILAYVDPADRERVAAIDRVRLDEALRAFLALVAWTLPGSPSI